MQPARLFALLLLLLAAALGLALGLGPAGWPPPEGALDLRGKRALLALLAGGSLSVAGAVMQAVLRNGLATPYTLGVSSAATFGAFLALAFPALALSPRAAALPLALAETLLVLLIANRSRRADGLILAGVTFNFLFGALMLLVRHVSDARRLPSMDRWLVGSVDVAEWSIPLSLLPWLGVGFALLAWRLSALDQLAFDPGLAEARGVSAKTARRDLLLAAGLLTAAVVAHTGPIGFLGLLVPHALRPFTGMRHAVLLPACFLGGAAFLLAANTLAQNWEFGGRAAELPVGILTALIGGPLFLRLLTRRGP